MKHLLLTTIAAVLVVGCGESQQAVPAPESKPVEPVAEVAKPEPPTAKASDISIHQAAKDGNIEAVKQHLDAGADVNTKDEFGRTPLHGAAYKGHKETVELLIAKGADVNAKDKRGWTPLHWVVSGGHKEIVELLIAKGADVNEPHLRWTLLHSAAGKGHKEIAELLIANGADVNAKDKDRFGSTPLSKAVIEGHNEIVELLIAAGADVNAKDVVGRTPLFYATDHKEIAELLIANGADVNAKDGDGWSVLDMATRLGHPELADLLRKHGGKTSAELALIPRLEYGKNQWPFDFSFIAKKGKTYVVEVTQDFKQWGELETIKGTGKWVKFIDPRQPLVQFKRNFYRVKVVD